MKIKSEHKICGIYCIRNTINNKVYIGKAINIYNRIRKHITYLRTKDKDENPYLINAWYKYGESNFEYYVIETLPVDDELVAQRELYWMMQYDSLNPLNGYNLRADSDSRMIVHNLTRQKISNRLKTEWANGIRKQHAMKLKLSWQKDESRKSTQSNRFSKTLTKWQYQLYTLNNEFVDTVNYIQLKELKLHNCIATFHKKSTNKIKFKTYIIIRVKIEDIV